MKYAFKDDYSEGCHPNILQKLAETNLLQTIEGNYGEDIFSEEARKLIHQKLQNPQAKIHFVTGGTQANLLIISSFLKPYEAVISAESGHIEHHEAGAIEATGHKIITVPSETGKLYPNQIQNVLDGHHFEHMVVPKMVYISNATELGTVYTKEELKALYDLCQTKNLLLFMDGARLGTAIASSKTDLDLKTITQTTDVFYIGGTKNGALLGEAIVINNPLLQPNFRHAMKQRGALLAKGRILGIQFLELFREDLFIELGKHANQQAQKLAQGIQARGFNFLSDPECNQVFPVLPNNIIQQLSLEYSFHIWDKVNDESSVIRLVTSWATKDEVVEQFLRDLDNKLNHVQ